MPTPSGTPSSFDSTTESQAEVTLYISNAWGNKLYPLGQCLSPESITISPLGDLVSDHRFLLQRDRSEAEKSPLFLSPEKARQDSRSCAIGAMISGDP
jgi:hypothetical protein